MATKVSCDWCGEEIEAEMYICLLRIKEEYPFELCPDCIEKARRALKEVEKIVESTRKDVEDKGEKAKLRPQDKRTFQGKEKGSPG